MWPHVAAMPVLNEVNESRYRRIIMFKTSLAAGAFALITVFSTTLPTYAAGPNPAAPAIMYQVRQ